MKVTVRKQAASSDSAQFLYMCAYQQLIVDSDFAGHDFLDSLAMLLANLD